MKRGANPISSMNPIVNHPHMSMFIAGRGFLYENMRSSRLRIKE